MATTLETSASQHLQDIAEKVAAAADGGGGATATATTPPARGGGRIVIPDKYRRSPRGSMVIHDDPRTKTIPLDRGGKNLPRFMQETGASKRKLQSKRAAQLARRRLANGKGHAGQLSAIEHHRRQAEAARTLHNTIVDLLRRDEACELDLQHYKAELEELEGVFGNDPSGLDDAPRETTRARMEREFHAMESDMKTKVRLAKLRANALEASVQAGQEAHIARMEAMAEAHRAFVAEKRAALEAAQERVDVARSRARSYLAEHESSISAAEVQQRDSERAAARLERRVRTLAKALAKEDGMDLHRTKMLNAKNYRDDQDKYQQIISHLQMENQQLSVELSAATAQRDALVEESRLWHMEHAGGSPSGSSGGGDGRGTSPASGSPAYYGFDHDFTGGGDVDPDAMFY